jgi:hypothetical protein
METGRSYGQKHAATWEEVEKEIVIQNIPNLTSEVGLELVRTVLKNCCSPMVRVLPMMNFEN